MKWIPTRTAACPACLWGQEYEIEFVKLHLGPVLKANGISTKIWLFDHNYNLWGRAICELDDPGVREYANSIAWHGYAGGASMMSKVHDAHPDAITPARRLMPTARTWPF